MRPYAAKWQRGANPGRFLAPASATGPRIRNAPVQTRLVRRILVSGTKKLATDITLPDYPAAWPFLIAHLRIGGFRGAAIACSSPQRP
jgi:hypothetical protein